MTHPGLILRPALPADREFLLRVYAASREMEMAMVPWPAEQKDAFLRMQFEAQDQHYRAKFPAAEHSVITANGEDVGRVYVVREEERIHILDIAVLLPYRRRGFATEIVLRLQEEARTRACPLTIYVEEFNPSLHLFETLGFAKESSEGIHQLLRWLPRDTKPKLR